MKRTDFIYEGQHPVIMLAHNAKGLTEMAVHSVLNQDIPTMLTLIDNDSSDGTSEWAEARKDFYTFTFRPPLGVSSGWNFALTEVFRHFDFCLVVNNDAMLRPDTYRELLADGGEFVTAVSVDNPQGIVGDWRRALRPHPDFSCFLIRKSVWEKIGGFNETMKLYASDADYHLRMHNAGIEAYTIGIPFYHYASGTMKFARPLERAELNRQADADRDTFERIWNCKVGSPEYYAKFGHGAPDEKETTR